MFDLTGKNAIITGSSKGIGKSIAAAMAHKEQMSSFQVEKQMFVKRLPKKLIPWVFQEKQLSFHAISPIKQL